MRGGARASTPTGDETMVLLHVAGQAVNVTCPHVWRQGAPGFVCLQPVQAEGQPTLMRPGHCKVGWGCSPSLHSRARACIPSHALWLTHFFGGSHCDVDILSGALDGFGQERVAGGVGALHILAVLRVHPLHAARISITAAGGGPKAPETGKGAEEEQARRAFRCPTWLLMKWPNLRW